MGPKILLLLCFAVAFRPGYCEPKSSGDEQRARLPEFLTELDLASLEASEEDIEALKTVVKRLAPEKNGEYQVYQVFFGNEELLNEWLKGAGVMGQPGVDFPALTTIPPTSFSCRGSKGGYYADLETNCQVFHICDNGRKISFLCPNGTIFQQSQLICDWWFKVDCSKSTELYEQSSEQLVEEERKRSDAKRMNSEFHRSSSEIDDSSGQNYYQSGNSNYDGRQNGRTNPYGQTFNKNQIPGSVDQRGINDDTKSSIKPFDPSQIFVSNGPINNQFDQINELAASNVNKVSQDANGNSGPNNDNYNVRQQQQIQPSSSRSSSDRGNYRTVDRQQNQLVEGANREEKRQFNYEQRGTGKFTGSNQNSYQNQQQQQQEQQHSGRSNQQSLDYSSSNRKGASDRRNFSKGSSVSSTVASSDYELSSNRVTPSYTETTTFRTSTPSPIREYQQLAESAAFVSNRGNRFNDAYSSSQFNNYYNLNNNGNNDSNGNNGNNGNNNNSNNNNVKSRIQQKPTEKPRQKSITPTPGSDKITGSFVRIRSGSATSPFPTFQPFYKPRTSNNYPSTGYETTSYGPTTTDAITTTNSPYTNTEYYTQSYQDKTTYNDNFDYTTTTSYPTNQDYQTTTEYPNTDSYTEDYLRNSVTPNNYQTTITNSDYFENTTPTIITSGSYVNAKSYTNGKTISTNVNYKISGNSAFTTLKPYYKSQEYRQNSVATPEPIKPSTVRRSDSSSHYVTTPATYRDVTIDQNVVSAKNADNRVSNNQKSRALINNPPKANTPSSYRALENSIATSTEKNSRLQTGAFQQNGSTGKTLSPYDTSITYQHGKVMSTLGPYVPFTKNYAYSTTTTTTTAKPPAYTATVPTYSSTVSAYRATGAKSLGPKVRVSSLAPPRSTSRFRSGYLPEKKSDPSNYLTKKHNLNERPTNEREHAISMLQSLRGLEGTVPSLLSVTNSTRSGLNIPASSGPSTLHSLALYFATASDNYNSPAESRTNTAAKSDTSGRISARVRQGNTSYELPKTILTQHTINSYAELFNLNNAVEGNSSVENIFDQAESGEDSDDLDIQQSEGPIAGARKSNNTKLRELAQVFTHALSAYLQDPDTFKKILTEIRPTEPSTINDDDATFTATTLVPTTSEDYPSVTKEKDEVLDFSDDTTPPRPRRPTTVYPTTTDDPIITTDGFTQDYYTTGGDYYTTAVGGDQSGPDNNFAFQVNHAFGNTGNTGNELNSGTGSGLYYPEEATGPSGPSAFDDAVNNDGLNDYADNYFPTNYKKGNSKIGGFQNNTSTPKTYEPYGKYVKPDDATPIGDNYVASSTPASYVQPYQPEVSKDEEDKNQRYNSVTNNFNPTTYFPQRDVENSQNSITSFNGIKPSISQSQKIITDRKSPTTKPFRIRYYDPTTSKPYSNNRESLATAETDYSTYRDNYNGFTDTNNGITERPTVVTVVTSRTAEPTTYTETGTFNTVTNNAEPTTTGFRGNYNQNNDGKFSDHWTSSPAVTQLWESTVFVDPKRINQGLVSSSGEFGTTTIDPRTVDLTDTTERIPSLAPQDNILHQRRENLVTDSSHSGLSSRNTNNNFNYPSSPWQWADGSGSSTVNNRGVRNENDSPTAFTLLPQTYTAMKQNIATATAAPMYTTRSSITTTITSSVTSTSSGASSNGGLPIRQDNVLIPSGIVQPKSSNRPKHGASTIGDSINDKDNEISMAHNMFGKLNSTSTNILMRVMKQADKDVTVRQLVLLLINHCNGPMNKTMEEEKEQLLDALLRMPVNEFTSEESRDLVAGINRINLPIGRSDSHGVKRSTTTTTIPSTTSTTEEPNVTTFRSKKSRKVKSNTEEASTTKSGKNGEVIGKEETNNRISIENNADSDARALELLRSLYTIAAKWG